MERVKVVFILGSGHCGATLLDLLLDSHSQLCGIGEFHAGRFDSICTCGKRADECEVWRAAMPPLPWPVQGIFKQKLDYLLDRGPYLAARGASTPVDNNAFIASNLTMFRKLIAVRGKKIIVDSSKEVERVELLTTSPDIEPIIIHLVRDNRGSTWTYIKKYKKLFPYFYLWALSNLKIEVFRRRFARISGGRGMFIYIRFSELVADPEATLKKLCEKIGVAYEPSMLLFDQAEHHQIEGNRTRFAPGHIIYPDSWRKDIPAALRIACTVALGWLNAYYTRLRRSFA